MDQQRFEELSRRVGTAATRRGALKVLVGGVAASAFALLRPGRGAADVDVRNFPPSIPVFHCRVTLQPCHDDRQCCSGICAKKVKIDPAPDPIEVPLPPPLPDAEIPLPDEVEGACNCREKGELCYVLLEGVMCCSGKCGPDAKCT